MNKKKKALLAGLSVIGTMTVATHAMKNKAKKTTYEATSVEVLPIRKRGIYEKYIKKGLDVVCASGAMVVFSPIYVGFALLVKIKLGSPVLFTQDRPGLIDENGKKRSLRCISSAP